jgi:hypothetical protein
MTHQTTPRSGAFGRRLRPAAALVAMLALAGCSDLLEVDDPDVALPGTLQGAAALPVLRAGGIGDFTFAFGGGGTSEGQTVMSGLFTDELLWTETFPTRQEVDRRGIQDVNSSMEAIYRNLHKARASLEFAIARYRQYDPESAELAELLNLLGFSYVHFAENYCAGVPFSTLTESGEAIYGAPETTAQMLARAEAAFTEAAALATTVDDDDQLNLARVGLGRALLDAGDATAAAAAVAAVPVDFEYVVEHSQNTSRQQNAAYNYVNLNRRFSVSNDEGGNGLDFIAADDPRVPYQTPDPTRTSDYGVDGESLLWRQLKYPSRDANVVLANGIEARLIVAEALLATNPSAAYDTLNVLRADAGLAALTMPGTDVARQDELFRERGFWLYLTSHRLGDLRRLMRDYGRPMEEVYPSGAYHTEGQYNDDNSFPVPSDELNNPLFQSCDNEGQESAL